MVVWPRLYVAQDDGRPIELALHVDAANAALECRGGRQWKRRGCRRAQQLPWSQHHERPRQRGEKRLSGDPRQCAQREGDSQAVVPALASRSFRPYRYWTTLSGPGERTRTL